VTRPIEMYGDPPPDGAIGRATVRTWNGPIRDEPQLLASEFFFLAHDDRSGRLRSNLWQVRLGLAASVLAELLYTGHVLAADGTVYVTSRQPPTDALAQRVWTWLLADHQQNDLRTWLLVLAEECYELVARRLCWQQKVREVHIARLFRGPAVVYVPANANVGAWTWSRISVALREDRPLSVFDNVLMSIAAETGVHAMVLDGLPKHARRYVEHLRDAPQLSRMRELLVALSVVVGTGIAAHRT
jgi:hypothetical protein